VELVKAIRDQNVPLLRQFYESGRMLQSNNRFVESLLHMACRRGYTDVVRFLIITEADVSLRIKDDYGRTPLHDACCSASPNFELTELIIEHDPDLLIIEDGRGHSPFSYARRSHWEE
jgi:ankyrin repeat protein